MNLFFHFPLTLLLLQESSVKLMKILFQVMDIFPFCVYVGCCHFFFLLFLVLFFFYYHVSPLYSPNPCNHHAVVHVHESFSYFAQSLHILTPPPELSTCSLSMILSLFCLLVQFIH